MSMCYIEWNLFVIMFNFFLFNSGAHISHKTRNQRVRMIITHTHVWWITFLIALQYYSIILMCLLRAHKKFCQLQTRENGPIERVSMQIIMTLPELKVRKSEPSNPKTKNKNVFSVLPMLVVLV